MPNVGKLWVPGSPYQVISSETPRTGPNPDVDNLISFIITNKEGWSFMLHIPFPPWGRGGIDPSAVLIMHTDLGPITWVDVAASRISKNGVFMIIDKTSGINLSIDPKLPTFAARLKTISNVSPGRGPSLCGVRVSSGVNWHSRCKMVSETWLKEAEGLALWANGGMPCGVDELFAVLIWISVDIPGIPEGNEEARFLGSGVVGFADLRGNEEQAIVAFHILLALAASRSSLATLMLDELGTPIGGGQGVIFSQGYDFIDGFRTEPEMSQDEAWLVSSVAFPHHPVEPERGSKLGVWAKPRGRWETLRDATDMDAFVERHGGENSQDSMYETRKMGKLVLTRVESRFSLYT